MRTVFFARVKGSDGSFQPSVSPTPNPFNPTALAATPVRGGAGSYQVTFGTGFDFPTSEFKVNLGIEGGAPNANIQYTTAPHGLVFVTQVGAVATDEDFWFQIQIIGDTSAS